MPKTPNIPHSGSAYALTRFFLRMLIFSVFATLGHQEFSKSLGNMLILAFIYCIVAAALRGEKPGAPVLTHFDEAAAYAAIAVLAARISS